MSWRWLWPKGKDSEADKLELDAEIEAHLAMAAADARARGLDDAAAQREARRDFGNVALVKDVTREAWGWVWLERIQQDLKYALRQMRKSKGFAIAVVGTLALGIGAATAMFTVVDDVMLKPLPYRSAGRIVEIDEGADLTMRMNDAPYLDIAAWREQTKSFESIAFYAWKNGRSFLEGRGATAQIGLTQVSENIFEALGVAPQMGAGWGHAPESFAMRPDAHTAVISDAAWRTLLGADPQILGKTVRINGEPYTVVGVMPRGFYFPDRPQSPQVWTPIALGEKDKGRTDDSPGYSVVARLRRGVTLAEADAELKTVQPRVAEGYVDPKWRANASKVSVEKFGASNFPFLADTKHALLALTGAAGLLWLIACVNATNLLLARSTARQREIAMRGALGASRWRLTQQMVIEGLVLSGAAAVLGAGLAFAAVRVFHHLLQQHLPYGAPTQVSLRVLLALAALTLVSAVVSSAWPAFLAARSPIEPALRQGGLQSGTARSHHRLRSGLVIAEIAMSLGLLAACGLLLRTIYALQHVPLGFRTDHILVANMEIPTYRFATVNAATAIYEPLLERIQHLPGVDAAGLVTTVPLDQHFQMQLSIYKKKGESADGDENAIISQFKAVSPDLQRVFGFPMLGGR
ncbi:MAG TPA: ABC transporter permease, partial [Silvibacterium sp.]|nr:ABC transporter permease [Silvibacterium sp.]